jgi:sugar lactone lactonase YvrE
MAKMNWWAAVLALLVVQTTACGDDDGGGTPDTGPMDSGGVDTGPADIGGVDTGDVDAGPPRCGDGLEVPGAMFFPEGIARADDGTLYVGSLATGEIVSYAAGSGPAATFVAAGGALTNTVGLVHDAARSLLWVCNSNLETFMGAQVVGIATADGTVTVSHAFPTGAGFCNDIALDADGNLFATDSVAQRIIQIPAADALTADSAAVWSEDAMYGVGEGEFGLNGIVVEGGNVYTVIFANGKVFRTPVETDGTAGTIEEITPAAALMGPDGIKRLAADTIGVLQNASGTFSSLDVSGSPATVTEISTGLDAPSTFAVDSTAGVAWVVESQVNDLLGGTDPDLPFCVRRVALP